MKTTCAAVSLSYIKMSKNTPHVTFGQVTVFVIEIERRPTPPPVLVKVPNPYVRHAPMLGLLEPPTNLDDAIAMVLQWTREMANRSPDLFIPPSDSDW